MRGSLNVLCNLTALTFLIKFSQAEIHSDLSLSISKDDRSFKNAEDADVQLPNALSYRAARNTASFEGRRRRYSRIGVVFVRKKSVENIKRLPPQEDVCKMIVTKDFRPSIAFEANGSLVEVSQDPSLTPAMTFVECEEDSPVECHGINSVLFSSQCITVYETYSAFVRLFGSSNSFEPGHIKIPIACQCKLRMKGIRMFTNF
ncbi:hypothetical protein AB6A40_007213 [Gnathostoma spinigerum]|uniref:Uncharacterized protein n=1 Tax=Gnathostoma spinigerum TaxID=75299 RepID=A0ABD6EKL5_9BILA